MMNSKYIKWLKTGVLFTFGVFAFTGCSDDEAHFDANSSRSTESLWAGIQSRGELSSFVKILQQTVVMKNDNDASASLTYDEYLNSAQTFTVWAPKDGSYDADYYLKLLQDGKAARDTGNVKQALANNRIVETQFVRNHLARNAFSKYATDIEVKLMNGKLSVFNSVDKTFNDVAFDNIVDDSQLGYANGTLHILSAASPFLSNLYEYMKLSNDMTDMYAYISAADTVIFSKSASTAGATVNGEIQYVDSVFYTRNDIIGNYPISNEDSMFVAVYPTNNGFESAKTLIKKYYTYDTVYNYSWNNVLGQFTKDDYKINADSLATAKSVHVMLGLMYFTTSWMDILPAQRRDPEVIKTYVLNADSLISVDKTIVYNVKGNTNPIFTGTEPTLLSNGLVYLVDNFNYDPLLSFHIDRSFHLNNSYKVVHTSDVLEINSSTKGQMVSLKEGEDGNRNELILGDVPENSYRKFEGSSRSAKPEIDLRLTSILSGNYKISVIFVPKAISLDDYDPDAREDKIQVSASIIDDKAKELIKSDKISISAEKVDTIQFFERFKFPYSYVGLEQESFPILHIKLENRPNSGNTLCIAKVLIEALGEEE